MGLLDGLKDLYYSLEDRYYSLLDKLQERLPVYAVVDPVDKIVPSFAVVLLLLVVLLGWGAWSLAGGGFGGTTFLNASFQDADGNPLPNVPVQLIANGQTQNGKTNGTGTVSFAVPKNSDARIRVSLEGYQKIDETVSVADTNASKTFTLARMQQSKIKSVQFVDASGFPIERKLKLSVACANPGVAVPSDEVQTDVHGKISLEEPIGCGVLTVTVQDSAFKAKGYVLDSPAPIVKLEARETVPNPDSGQSLVQPLRVRLEDAQGSLLTDVLLKVALYKNDVFVLEKETANASVRFDDLEPGTYRVIATDPAGHFAGAPVENIDVSSVSPTQPVVVQLSRQILVNVQAIAQDRDSQEPIVGATLVFLDADSDSELARGTIAEDLQPVVFSSTENVHLKVQAMADGFVSETVSTSQTTGTITVSLERITPANSGTVTVKVVDAENDPVANAKVMLRYQQTQVIAPYGSEISDLNGIATFDGVKAEDLFAYAEKYPAAGASQAQKIVLGQDNLFSVRMDIGGTELTINALNDHDELIPNSTADIFDASNDFLGRIPLTNGTTVYKTKADKRIFIVVKNPDYLDYRTETFQLFKDNPIAINALLSSRLQGDTPKVEFVGVFDAEGKQVVTSMQAGKNYVIKMRLLVPENASFKKAGIHFRVGDQKTIENDNLVISNVNASAAHQIRGTSFNPPDGQDTDLAPQNLSTGDAKWAEFTWKAPQPGAYRADVGIFVKRQTHFNATLPFFYRGWGEKNDGSIKRDPLDAELGESLQTDAKGALYANSRAIVTYSEGQDPECDGDFCFFNLRVFDESEGLYLLRTAPQPFETHINQKYKLSFILTNNSQRNYEGARLSVRALDNGKETNDWKFLSYKITNASQQAFESAVPTNSVISNIDAGEFKSNTGVAGELEFLPAVLKTGSIEIRLVFNGDIVLEKIIDLEAVSDKLMNVEIEPNLIPAFTASTPVVHVTLNEPESVDNGMDLEGVLVSLRIETPDHSKIVLQQFTNKTGHAAFSLVPYVPNTKITVKAEKPNFFAQAFDIFVDGNILVFDPSELQSNLITGTKPEEELSVNVKNKVGLDLKMENIRLVGDFTGILDQSKMNGFLKQLVGHVFKANQEQDFAILRTALNEAYPILQGQHFDADLVFDVSNPAITQKLPSHIPVTINVALAGVPEELECLTVDETEFKGTTQDNTLSHSFTLTNNCKVGGKPIVLQNLQAALKWKDNAIGNVQLSLTQGSNQRSTNTVTLFPGDSVVLFDATKTGTSYFGQLDFVPKSGKLGKTAHFTVQFFAESPTASGTQKVSSKEITGEVLIANLETCLAYAAEFKESTSGAGNNAAGSSGTSSGTNAPTGTPGGTIGSGTGANTAAGISRTSPLVVNLQAAATGSAEEVQVHVPFGGEGALTIDSTACGNINIGIGLCLNDPGCSGGATQGKILLRTDRFELTPQRPSKTIPIKGTDIAGLYGLTVHAKTQGRDYQRVGIVDVIVDPNPDYYFTLDKYEFFLKGIGTKDTANLTNYHYGRTIIVDAPAINWANMKKPSESSAFSSMLPLIGVSMIPSMIGALQPALSDAFAKSKEVGDQEYKKFENAQNQVNTARTKAIDLADQCAPDNGVCLDARNLQQKLKEADATIKESSEKMKKAVLAAKNPLDCPASALPQKVKDCDGDPIALITGDGGTSIASQFGDAVKQFGSLEGGVCDSAITGSAAAPATIQPVQTEAFLADAGPQEVWSVFNGLPNAVRGPGIDLGNHILPLVLPKPQEPVFPGMEQPVEPAKVDPTAWKQRVDPDGKGTFVDLKTEWRIELETNGQTLRFVTTDFGQTTRTIPVWKYQNQLVSVNELDESINSGQPLVLGDNVSRVYANGKIAIPVSGNWIVGELPVNLAPHDTHQADTSYDAIANSDGTLLFRHSYAQWWDVFHWFSNMEWYSPDTGWIEGGHFFVSAQDVVVALPAFEQLISGNLENMPRVFDNTRELAGKKTIPALQTVLLLGAQSQTAFLQTTTSALGAINLACSSYKRGTDKVNQAVSGIQKAQKAGQFQSASQISSASAQSSQTIDLDAKTNLELAATNIQSGTTHLADARAPLDAFKTDFGHIKNKDLCLKNLADAWPAAAQNAVNGDSAYPNCVAKATAAKTVILEETKKMEDARNGIDGINNSLLDKIKDGGALPARANDAVNEINKAKDASNDASKAMTRMSQATRELSKDNAGSNGGGANSQAFTNAMTQATTMGLMAAMMGNMFKTPSNAGADAIPRIQNPQQVFSIDLRKDNKGVTLDRPGILADFTPDSYKSFGDNTKQQISVVMENRNLENAEPVYGTATFKATEHVYPMVARVPFNTPFGDFASGWELALLEKPKQPYSQQFHVRFVTGDFVRPIPPIETTAFSCTQGALVGRTGPNALPRVALSWNWSDVSWNQCDATNDNYSYCDAVQFSIMTMKRLKILHDFVQANPHLVCPTNPLEVRLNQDMAPISALTNTAFNAQDSVDHCWLPESTQLLDGYPAVLYYAKDAGSAVQWTKDIKNLNDLQNMVLFDAYLMQDGFTDDFLKDFSKYYTQTNFSDTPGWFSQDSQGKFSAFFDQKKIKFTIKGSNVNQLPTSGLYKVDLVARFGEGERAFDGLWSLFDNEGNPDGGVLVELLAERQTPFNSPFYYLPFDGLVGIEGGKLDRQGYGVAFDVKENEGFSISRKAGIKTLAGISSNPVQTISVSRENALEKLNARPSQRGFILDIASTSNTEKSVLFTPALATPLLLKVHEEKTADPFSAYYLLRNADVPETTGNNLTFWSGAGACRDFSGEIVATAFEEKPDRKTERKDVVDGWQFAYSVDWPKAVQPGDVYLKTVFYTPAEGDFSLTAQSTNAVFISPEQGQQKTVDLGGLSGMAFNRKGASDTDRVSALDDLFQLVKNGSVCVSNTGVRTSFWWNPKTIWEQKGKTGQSVADVETKLQANRSCIG